MTDANKDLEEELNYRSCSNRLAWDEELIREEYKGFLIRQSGAGWDVSQNGEHYMTYGSLISAKKGIDHIVVLGLLRELAHCHIFDHKKGIDRLELQ